LTVKRILGASLVGNIILAGADWFLASGVVFVLALLGAVAG
jgi:hypothetical protein